MEAPRKQARLAGLLYTLVAVTAPIGLIYVPGKLYVSGDAAATAERLRQAEPLMRLGMASELFHQTVEVFLVLALYALFKPVSKPLARQLAVMGLLPIPIVFANVLNEVAALMLAKGEAFLQVIDRVQLDALAFFFLRLHGKGLQVAGVFWGLWLIPFGLLVIRCGFIPRLLGWLLLLAGLGYVLDATAVLILPQFISPLGDIASVLQMGELPIILWLLIWGARARPAGQP